MNFYKEQPQSHWMKSLMFIGFLIVCLAVGQVIGDIVFWVLS